MHIRCPHCQGPIEIVEDSQWQNMSCPSCGSNFRLVDLATCSVEPARRQTLDHFELIHPVGAGAFGTVWKSRDTKLDRIVAVKIPRNDQLGPAEAEKFLREARAAAQLKHPNIVSVHEVGRANDTVYIVSDFVDGVSLADWLSAKRPTPREAAELCAQIAAALHHAHEAGVIHRDLKPSNIMMDRDGAPHIMDFGLAKRDAGEITMTVEGKLLGTPAYMSPEQARGQGHSADRRSDVYSLGVILFELLTGQLPFRGNTRMLLHQVLYDDAPSPRSLNKAISRDLETICSKCLHKDPDNRYQLSLALAEDLGRFAAGEAILARPDPLPIKLWRRARRHKVGLAASAVVALVVAASGFVGHRYFSVARRVEARTIEINRGLATPEISEAYLIRMEALIEELRNSSEDLAEDFRAKLNQTFAESLREKMNERGLTPDRLTPLQSALDLLEKRDPKAAGNLRVQLQMRLTRWEPIFRLSPPFTGIEAVFDRGTVHAQDGAMVRAIGDEPDTPHIVRTGISSQGIVEVTIRYDAPSWLTASQVGLLIDAADEAHYALMLRVLQPAAAAEDNVTPISFASARQAGGEIGLQIVRNNRILRAQRFEARELPDGPLQLKVSRSGESFSVSVPGFPPLQFIDVFSYGTYHGVFAVYWPAGVRVSRLEAVRQALPLAPRPLEKGDDLFARGPDFYAEALQFYREQASQSAGNDTGQEARYKEALCHVKLGGANEATKFLEPLSTEPGDRWPVLARCQLWLIYLRQNKLRNADEMLNSLVLTGAVSTARLLEGSPSANPIEQLATLVPDELFQELLRANIQRYSGFNAVRFDLDHVHRLEQLAAVADYLNFEPQDRLLIKLVQIHAYRMVGNTRMARKVTEETLARSDFALCPIELRLGLVLTHCWLQRELGEFPGALETAERFLVDESGDYRLEYVPLLLERARVYVRLDRPADAERDLDEFMRVMPRESMTYPEYARVWLMRGFLRERRGDSAGALEAWRQGVYKMSADRSRPEIPDPFRLGGWDSVLHGVVLGALSDDYKGADHEQLTALLAPLMGGLPPKLNPVMQLFGSRDLRMAFQSTDGRDFARRLAFLDLSVRDYLKLPVLITLTETVRNVAFGRELTPEERKVLQTVSELTYDTYFLSEMNGIELIAHVLGMLAVWNDTRDWPQRWAELAPKLSPELRAGMSYLFGMRFLVRNNPDVAAEFFRSAVAHATPDSLLRRQAQTELERLPDESSD